MIAPGVIPEDTEKSGVFLYSKEKLRALAPIAGSAAWRAVTMLHYKVIFLTTDECRAAEGDQAATGLTAT
jgi:hypothetical protein